MEQISTRRFFSSDFVVKYKLSFSTVILLQDIYFWLLSEKSPPKKLIINHKTFYFISQSHFVRLNYGLLNQSRVNKIFKELKEIGIIISSFLKDEKENYINFDWNKIKESLLPDEELQNMEDIPWWKKIHNYADEQIKQEQSKETETVYDTDYEIVKKGNRNYLVKKQYKEESSNSYNNLTEENKMDKPLLQTEKLPYSSEADSIARLILKRYSNLFKTKTPQEYKRVTKTYKNICTCIQDIYNGNFIKSRLYTFNDKMFSTKQFDTTNWKETLQEVKGDWIKVKKLILTSVKNYQLMYDENRMPYKKSTLTDNLQVYFYDKENERSLFIQSLKEPKTRVEKHDNQIIEKIKEHIKERDEYEWHDGQESLESACKLISLLPETQRNSKAWNLVCDILKWGDNLCEYEENKVYFLSGSGGNIPGYLPSFYADWLIKNNITINLSTIDIEKSVQNNLPWTWFVEERCKESKSNINLIRCYTEEDFVKYYNNMNTSFERDDYIDTLKNYS